LSLSSKNYVLFEDGKLIHTFDDVLWDGLFSRALPNGQIMQYIQSCLPSNTVFLIPQCDGNINRDKTNKNDRLWIDWDKQIKPYIEYAKSKNKIFILGTLCQLDVEPDCNYLYIPLDDNLFYYGATHILPKKILPPWESRSSELCWRGVCSGVGGLLSTRVRFVDKIYNYSANTNVRLCPEWREGKNIHDEYFAEGIHYTDFFKYKIFFIVDGNCIASNHTYGFASGCVPFLISRGICWFSELIIPYTHYIPVNYDLINLIEQIEWVKTHDEEAKKIAENAYQFADAYFSTEYQKKYLKENIEKYVNV
jgi:hypothetical protein